MAAKNWREVRANAHLDEDQISAHRQHLDEEVRAFRLSEIRRNRDLTQEQVATTMGVRQPRVSQLESGDLSHVEVATLRSYVSALGGRLRVVAEFGDDQLVLGN
jgi:predicted XRE-type DNA-binding protein